MADMVEATFDVTLQNPLRRNVLARQCIEQIFAGILCASSFSETKGFPICCCFRHRLQCQSIESLHCAVIHCRNAQWTLFLLVLLFDIHSTERTCTIPFICQRQNRCHFLRRSVPENTIHTGSSAPVVGYDTLNSQCFGVKGMCQKILKSFYCVVVFLLSCLDNPDL